MVRAVIFDCFGVLYIPVGEDFYHAHIPNYMARREELNDLSKQADYGLITQEELVVQVAELGGLNVNEVRQNVIGHLIRNQVLLDFAKKLRKTYKVGLLTNISSGNLYKYFAQAELPTYFDDVVVSSEVGMIKPRPGIYELAAKNLDIDIDECVLIDDSPLNCNGAIEAGMQAIVYQSTQQTIKDLERLLQ